MGGTETVEEVDEWKTSLDGGKMSHRSQVHNFLHRTFAEHAGTGLATCVYVGMVTENRQCV